jgi:metacaspase-1
MSSKKKGLCIGINYIGTANQLMGCSSDAIQMRDYLKKNDFDVNVLCDDKTKGEFEIPTKENIIKGLFTLVNLAKSDQCDTIVIHYSGHGGSTYDISGDEKDRKDEFICTVDNKSILDDELIFILSQLPCHVNCFCLFDACHSGTILDLQYHIKNEKVFEENRARDIRANIVAISGCRDDQCSADAYIGGGKYAGAMSYAFFSNVNKTDNVNKICKLMNITLNNAGYPQKPQVTMSKKILPNVEGYFGKLLI